MAFHAVLIVVDPFFTVFRGDPAFAVLMTAITGVRLVTAGTGVARPATCPVVAVEPEIAVVVERGGLPFFRAVANGAGSL